MITICKFKNTRIKSRTKGKNRVKLFRSEEIMKKYFYIASVMVFLSTDVFCILGERSDLDLKIGKNPKVEEIC